MMIPEVPKSWLILVLIVALAAMRLTGIDSFVTAALSTIIGYLLGRHLRSQ